MKMTSQTKFCLVLMGICVIGAIAGSFCDLQIAERLYTGDGVFYSLKFCKSYNSIKKGEQ